MGHKNRKPEVQADLAIALYHPADYLTDDRYVDGPRSAGFGKRMTVTSLLVLRYHPPHSSVVEVGPSWHLSWPKFFVPLVRDGLMRRQMHNLPSFAPADVKLLLEHTLELLYQTCTTS